jgi:hypothetical protein
MISPRYRMDLTGRGVRTPTHNASRHTTRRGSPPPPAPGKTPCPSRDTWWSCRHVSARPRALTGALRVRQALVAEIVQRLSDLSIHSRSTPWSPRFGLRQDTLANGLSTDQRLLGWARGRSVHRPPPPARPGSQLKSDDGGMLRGPRHPPLVSGSVPEVVDVPIDRTRLVRP